jgi:type I restriction enzyme S subunit
MGMIPEGWKIKSLGDLCDLTMGQSPKSEYYNLRKEGLPFHQGVTNFGSRYPIDRVYCTELKRIAEPGDILLSVRAPVGRINIAKNRMVVGRGLCAIRSKESNQAFLFQQLKETFIEEDSIGGGTIFKAVTKDDVLNIKLMDPPKKIKANFEEIAKPIFKLLEVLITKNRNLCTQRDILLPRLINGELDIN